MVPDTLPLLTSPKGVPTGCFDLEGWADVRPVARGQRGDPRAGRPDHDRDERLPARLLGRSPLRQRGPDLSGPYRSLERRWVRITRCGSAHLRRRRGARLPCGAGGARRPARRCRAATSSGSVPSTRTDASRPGAAATWRSPPRRVPPSSDRGRLPRRRPRCRTSVGRPGHVPGIAAQSFASDAAPVGLTDRDAAQALRRLRPGVHRSGRRAGRRRCGDRRNRRLGRDRSPSSSAAGSFSIRRLPPAGSPGSRRVRGRLHLAVHSATNRRRVAPRPRRPARDALDRMRLWLVPATALAWSSDERWIAGRPPQRLSRRAAT